MQFMYCTCSPDQKRNDSEVSVDSSSVKEDKEEKVTRADVPESI